MKSPTNNPKILLNKPKEPLVNFIKRINCLFIIDLNPIITLVCKFQKFCNKLLLTQPFDLIFENKIVWLNKFFPIEDFFLKKKIYIL